MKQVIGLTLALLTITGSAWAGPETTKKDTQGTRDTGDTGAPDSRPGYHGDTSSKHGNANFPERPESQHGHGVTPGGPQH